MLKITRNILFSVLMTLPFSACEKKNDSASQAASENATPAMASQNLSIPATQPVPGDLVITAEVLEIPGPFPANELYNYAYVMRYKVIKVIKGTLTDAEILIAHYNPRIARAEIKDEQDANVGGNLKSFQVGDIHYLVLSPMEGIWTGASEDDFYKNKSVRYWAFWADKLK
jgi:hypothetical protein